MGSPRGFKPLGLEPDLAVGLSTDADHIHHALPSTARASDASRAA